MTGTLCVLVLKSMILLASKLPQNPIFITILSDNPHLKTIKRYCYAGNQTKYKTKSNKIFLTKKGLELCSLDTSRNAQQYGAEHFR